ncbi:MULTISPECIES: hypothetical protein [Dickeya]|uniref:Uncharacterized protein n=1 Tax=Dickeya oryzae TaxID=1240404 RepID=A0AB39IED5_9GAMM|nr:MULTISPECIES: hypothetical protein [Dickeya]MBP2851056.1 hypothetical protein [Dickeya oryzae]MCA6991922.1 hypothetical protein [Dickeya oryzae]MCA6995209.1 hypothetical protein [Dickeya oryzae]
MKSYLSLSLSKMNYQGLAIKDPLSVLNDYGYTIVERRLLTGIIRPDN